MGSIEQARTVGFICRLCAKQKKNVFHLYSSKGRNLDLINKIKLLPISLQKYDKLPKTICESCIDRLDKQSELVKKIRANVDLYRAHRRYHTDGTCPAECPLFGR